MKKIKKTPVELNKLAVNGAWLGCHDGRGAGEGFKRYRRNKAAVDDNPFPCQEG